jgi:hypothetical protein
MPHVVAARRIADMTILGKGIQEHGKTANRVQFLSQAAGRMATGLREQKIHPGHLEP